MHTIRPLASDDLDKIYAIELASYDFPWHKSAFHQINKKPNYCWVIEDNINDVNGFISFTLVLDECHITNFAVASNFQNQGLGKQLLDFTILNLDDVVNTIWLEVQVNNTKAIRLYEQVGFVYVYTRKNYYRTKSTKMIDALVYCRDIS